MKKYILILLLLSTRLLFGQINNNSFEVWDSTYVNAYSNELNTNFGVPNPYGGELNNWTYGSGYGNSQTTDSYSGNYSLILHNWYNYAQEWITYHDSLSYRPQYLRGYFKYITGGSEGISQGTMNITLTRFNGASNDTIATGIHTFDSTASFSPFQVTLNYISPLDPDSITIYAINANSSCGFNVVCHLLYLDDLTLTNFPLGIENSNSNHGLITAYPNPTTDIINLPIETQSEINVLDINGKIVLSKILSPGELLSLGQLSKGIYCIKVKNEKGISAGKIIVNHND